MGYRTHLTLKVYAGVGYVEGIDMRVERFACPIYNFCIGSRYFNDLPEDLESFHKDHDLYFFDVSSDDGEIRVRFLLAIIDYLEKNPTHPWYESGIIELKDPITKLLNKSYINDETFIQFDVY